MGASSLNATCTDILSLELYNLLLEDVSKGTLCLPQLLQLYFMEIAPPGLTSIGVSSPMHPCVAHIRMAGDASAYSIRAIIAHVLPERSECPVAFASHTLTRGKRNYAQVEKEALSLTFGLPVWMKVHNHHRPQASKGDQKKGIPPLAAAQLQKEVGLDFKECIQLITEWEQTFITTHGTHPNPDDIPEITAKAMKRKRLSSILYHEWKLTTTDCIT